MATFRADERPCKVAVSPDPLLLTWLHQALYVDSPLSRRSCFSRAAFEPSDADLNLIGEQDEDVVMVDSDDQPLKKSKAKVAYSDDELKGKVKAKKIQKSKSKSKSRRCLDHDGDDAIESEFESDEDDDMSDFIVKIDEDEEEKDARLALKWRLGKRKVIIVLDSDKEMDTSEEQEVVFGHKKMPVSEEAITLMPKFLPSTKMKVGSAALIFFNTWLSPLAAYDGGPHEGHRKALGGESMLPHFNL